MEKEGGQGDDAPNSCNEEGVKCRACEEPILGRTCLSDDSCSYHKECLELPNKMKSRLHMNHPLIYSSVEFFSSDELFSSFTCDLCDEKIEADHYSCKECDFDLHINCARPPCIFQDHKHHFVVLLNHLLGSISYTCNACGTLGDLDSKPCICTTCQCIVHSKCINLDPTIRIGHHHHPITLIYDIFQHNPADTTIQNSCCGICQKEFKTEYGGYVCASCSFVSHVDCALPYVNRDREVLEIKTAKRKVGAKDEMASGTAIKHSSHSHELIAVDEEVSDEDDKRCNGCLLPILPPFYTCRECNFCLDKTCINLPQGWRDIFFNNLVLRPKVTDLQIRDIIRCFYCAQYIQIGFHYVYSGSGLGRTTGVDVRCAKFLMKTTGLMHKGHHHQLFYTAGRVDEKIDFMLCNACGKKGYHILRCEICNSIWTSDVPLCRTKS